MSERTVTIRGESVVLDLVRDGELFVVSTGERRDEVEVLSIAGNDAVLRINGRRRIVPFHIEGETVHFAFGGETFQAELSRGAQVRKRRHHEHSMTAPMPGVVLEIFAAAGDVVTKGTPLLILEAMKMEHPISAPYDGIVEAVHCSRGELVQPGVDLISILQKEEP
ncbi:MAG TPA: biotin/lipoyl-containing protein [Thermoanaerobaculia bacterium]|nr:biotin/lipoyl-containing protein [Thermoanaerobaculia bacterium]